MNIRNNIETTRVVNSKINLSILKRSLLYFNCVLIINCVLIVYMYSSSVIEGLTLTNLGGLNFVFGGA